MAAELQDDPLYTVIMRPVLKHMALDKSETEIDALIVGYMFPYVELGQKVDSETDELMQSVVPVLWQAIENSSLETDYNSQDEFAEVAMGTAITAAFAHCFRRCLLEAKLMPTAE